MALVNTSKPSAPSFTNITKVSDSVTWDTWVVAWQSETRTWDELISTMDNTARASSSGITNLAKPS